MQFRVIFFLVFLLTPCLTYGKFAPWVVEIPCNLIKLKINSCQEFKIDNYELGALKKHNKIEIKGSLTTGTPLDQTPVKCHDNQKMNPERFNLINFSANKSYHFLVRDRSCSDIQQGQLINIRTIMTFCDTPNAMMIKDCFFGAIQHKKNLYIVDQILN